MRGTSVLVALLVAPCLLVAQVPMQDDSSQAEGDSLQIFAPASGWSLYSFDRSTALSLPQRGISNYLPLIPGVIAQNGEIHVRGSRDYETSYLLDGINVTNAFFNSNGVPLIPEAMERLDVHTGAYEAALGSATGGVVAMTMREGGERLEVSGDFRTDDFLKPGNQQLNTSSYGYRNAVVTVSGPLPFGVKFFAAAEHHFERDRQPMFLEPFRYDSLMTDINDARGAGVLLPGPIEFKRNYLYNNWLERNTVQANVTWRGDKLRLKLIGSYSDERMPIGNDWPEALQNAYREARNFTDKRWTQFAALQLTHELSPELSYAASFSWYRRYERTIDPVFGNNWELYPDSLVNAFRGYDEFASKYRPPFAYSTIINFIFGNPNTPSDFYRKNRQASVTGKLDVEYKPSDTWTIGGGLSYQQWTIRSYSIGMISLYMRYLYGEDGRTPRTFTSTEERRYLLTSRGGIDNYGYSYTGSTAESGVDAPREPVFFSSYIQTKVREEDLEITAGLRHEVFDTRSKVLPNPLHPFSGGTLLAGYMGEAIDPASLQDQKIFTALLPRLSLRFTAPGNLTGFMSYGNYARMPALNLIYRSTRQNDRVISIYTRGNVFRSAYEIPTFFVEPERMNQVEVGIGKEFARGFSLGLTGYWKRWPNQVQMGWADTGSFNNEGHYMGLRNDGSSQAKGLEVAAGVSMGSRLSLQLLYALSEVKGLSAEPGSNAGPVIQSGWSGSSSAVSYMTYHDYNQTHRGTLMGILEGLPADGPILGGTSLLVVFTFSSGHAYTREAGEPTLSGMADPWDVGTVTLAYPELFFPAEVSGSSTTPWVTTIDLALSKTMDFDFLKATVYLHVLNLLNTKNVLNVYPATGSPDDDGWLGSAFAQSFLQGWGQYSDVSLYQRFYRTINLENRWAYMGATGYDIYGSPRQVRLGVRVEY